jgi:hypothetical protein
MYVVCMYVCMYVCVIACMFVLCTYVHMLLLVGMCYCMYVYVIACTYVYVIACMYVLLYVPMNCCHFERMKVVYENICCMYSFWCCRFLENFENSESKL